MGLSALAISISLGVQGKRATYTPPVGASLDCRVMQHQGDLQRDTANRLRFGNMLEVWREAVAFDVAVSDLPNPVPGGVVMLSGGSSYTITAPPVRRDPARLVWTIDCSFGMPIVYRPVSRSDNQPETQSPPVHQSLRLAADAEAGASVVDLATDYAFVGRVIPGDVLVIGDVDHTVTNAVQADGITAVGVQITPPLVAAAVAGTPVAARWVRDVSVHAGVSAYLEEEIGGKVQLGDMRVILMRDLLVAAGFTGDPTETDMIFMLGSTWTVQEVVRYMQGASVLCYELRVRGNT